MGGVSADPGYVLTSMSGGVYGLSTSTVETFHYSDAPTKVTASGG